uniref:Uncharacterized protein n=1 Tax=Arundo donax TaxID=35708 RepID=A0A0A9CH50_ARUDO
MYRNTQQKEHYRRIQSLMLVLISTICRLDYY